MGFTLPLWLPGRLGLHSRTRVKSPDFSGPPKSGNQINTFKRSVPYPGCTLGFNLRVTQAVGYSSHSETPNAKGGRRGVPVPINSIPLKSRVDRDKDDGSHLITSGGLLALLADLEPLRRRKSTSASPHVLGRSWSYTLTPLKLLHYQGQLGELFQAISDHLSPRCHWRLIREGGHLFVLPPTLSQNPIKEDCWSATLFPPWAPARPKLSSPFTHTYAQHTPSEGLPALSQLAFPIN